MCSQWADLKVRVDKCHVFGMKKEKTEAKQYLPKIIINRERIPPVEMDKSFDYLGKTFSFMMDTKNIQKDIDEELQSYLTKTDQQLLHPLNKVKIVTYFIYSKLNGDLPSMTSRRHGLPVPSIAKSCNM